MSFKKFAERFGLSTAEKPINPSLFGDSLAEQISWEPLSPGGTNIRSRKLTRSEPHLLELAPTGGSLSAGAAFVLFAVLFVVERLYKGTLVILELLPVSIFLFLGLGLLLRASMVTVFDQRSRQVAGYFGVYGDEASWFPIKRTVPFEAIHAMQIIREKISRQGEGYYWSYELNLVLKDGMRCLVMDHGQLQGLRKDAQTLSRLLDIPLWDATLQQEGYPRSSD
ncbi:MAG: hypothetical protein KDC54_20815 [Lewinella sp.]|nr:hypothetical protein [Lewinella sp.]